MTKINLNALDAPQIALVERIKGAAKRVETLAERLEVIGKTGKIQSYGGYCPGCCSPFDALEDVFGGDAFALDGSIAAMAKIKGVDSPHAMLEYHYTNVTMVVNCYFIQLLEGKFTPNKTLIDDMVDGCRMVAGVLNDYANAILEQLIILD